MKWNSRSGFTCTLLALLRKLLIINDSEYRNRTRLYFDFPAVAVQMCLILLAIQALTALSDHIIFNPFGVRFGVR
jgi:hypothetical protein